MSVSAIICEFNPLHHGHAYILGEIRRNADCVIAIMSGNFVQRAEPAILDKYARAELALKGGADLVVELPMPWCAASAEYFAGAGTAIAEMLGADTLSFGVGAADPGLLFRAAEIFLDPAVQEEIKATAQTDAAAGIASVREKCLKSKLGAHAADLLRSPNDILAIEYLKQIRTRGYGLQPELIPRLTTAENPRFCGATAIRDALRTQPPSDIAPHMPDFSYERIARAFETGEYVFPDALFEIAFQALRISFERPTASVADGEGGLLDRLYNAAQSCASAEEMLAAAATKKYTNARIRRVLLYYLLGITRQELRAVPAVTTLLAANAVGCAHLSAIRKSSPLKILTKPADFRSLLPDLAAQYRCTQRADSLYTLCLKSRVPAGFYLKKRPYLDTEAN